MEVSQLLRLYQARGWEALPAEDLLLYLKKSEHSGYQPGRETGGFRQIESGLWAGKRGVCMLITDTLLSFSGKESEGNM